MTRVKKLLHTAVHGRRRAILRKFVADPPTTTLQRLKALLTGGMPTFIDVGTNFGGSEVAEDNLMAQWRRANRTVVFSGDDTWLDLFPHSFSVTDAHPSFNVRDLDSVDVSVRSFFGHWLPLDFDVLIGHMLGVDHCGHTFGAKHAEMQRKLDEVDRFVGEIVAKLRPTDHLVVLGDHGMTATGDHGGASKSEVEAALILYHQDGFPDQNGLSSWIWQIDLVPYLSLITGVPIPFSNLGVIDLTSIPRDRSGSSTTICALNFDQITRYQSLYVAQYGALDLPHVPTNLSSNISACSNQHLAHLRQIRDVFREKWTRFDDWSILIGCLIMATGLLHALPLATRVRPWLLVVAFATIVCIELAASVAPSVRVANVAVCLLLCARSMGGLLRVLFDQPLAVLVATIAPFLINFSNSFVVQEMHLCVALLIFLQLWRFTRSLCIKRREFKLRLVWPFLLSVIILRLSLNLEICREESPKHSNCIQKEQSSRNTADLAGLAIPSPIYYVLYFAGFFALPATILYQFGNYCQRMSTVQRVAHIWLHLLATLCVTGSWLLDAMIHYVLAAKNLSLGADLSWFGIGVSLLSQEFAQSVRVRLAQASLLFSCLGLLQVVRDAKLFHQVPSDASSTRQVTFTGLATAYSAWTIVFLQHVVAILSVLLGPSNVPGLVCLFGAVCCIAYSLHFESDSVRRHLMEVVQSHHVALLVALVSCWSFYVTGHQPTLSAIPWEAAFTARSGADESRLWPALMVLGHLFSGPLLVAFAIPFFFALPLHSSQSRFSAREFELAQSDLATSRAISRLCQRVAAVQLFWLAGSVVATASLRRHLMVWKIFTPHLLHQLIHTVLSLASLTLLRVLFLRGPHRITVFWLQRLLDQKR